MASKQRFCLLFVSLLLLLPLEFHSVLSEDAYRLFNWNLTFQSFSPLAGSAAKKVVLINGQFPGPEIDAVTNENLVINVFNGLDEPLLLTWNGVWQRRMSWQDGVPGTNCPILPGQNFTYQFQVKDQVGTYFYFPSTGFLKAAGGYGSLKINNRIVIPLPYKAPDGDQYLLIGDWYNANHTDLQAQLDNGEPLGLPDGVLINGKGPFETFLTLEAGKTYRIRISNVGIATSLNFRIQGHKLLLVEVEGSHTTQNFYDNLDIHVGQSCSVLVTLDQNPGDYYIIASTRFTSPVSTGIGILHYSNSLSTVSEPLPPGPTIEIDTSINQARTIRWNLTANAARPNPQGSYRYGMINVTRTIIFAGSSANINGKRRFTVNGISYIPSDTPLKLADYFNIPDVFSRSSIPDSPSGISPYLGTSVVEADFRAFIEVILQNEEDAMQTWHFDGYSAFVLGMDGGQWSPSSRDEYNLFDAVARSTTQVYPQSWTAVMMELNNVGMWNVRSQIWERQYLGQQLYMRVFSPAMSLRDEAPIPSNVILCGKAAQTNNS